MDGGSRRRGWRRLVRMMGMNRLAGDSGKNIPGTHGSVISNSILQDTMISRNFMMNRRTGFVRLNLRGGTRKGRRQQRIAREQHPRFEGLEFKAVFLFGGRVQNDLNGG